MADNKYPRVLVISHNPFSKSQNNGKTLSAFFEGWPKSKIAQVFLTLDEIDNNVCNNFFRITDLDVLGHMLNRNKAIGQRITVERLNDEEKQKMHQNHLYCAIRKMFIRRSPLASCIRSWCWEIVKPWQNENIVSWIDDFKPQAIFFQSSNSYAIFDMVLFIAQKYNIPLFMETTDDYLAPKLSLNPFFWYDHHKMIQRYRLATRQSETIFAIGEQMKKEYSRKFGGNFKIAMNSIDVINKEVTPYSEINNDILTLTYAGNLGLNRWKILRKIGLALREINKEGKIKARLDIYSIDKPNSRILNALTIQGIMAYKGVLAPEELLKVKDKSDLLVHVESFDKKNRYITRLSVSTKIPEYLLSQRCILAIGPKDVASIAYLSDHKIGYVISSPSLLIIVNKLKNILNNKNLREKYIRRGYKHAKINHSFVKNKRLVQSEIVNHIYLSNMV